MIQFKIHILDLTKTRNKPNIYKKIKNESNIYKK